MRALCQIRGVSKITAEKTLVVKTIRGSGRKNLRLMRGDRLQFYQHHLHKQELVRTDMPQLPSTKSKDIGTLDPFITRRLIYVVGKCHVSDSELKVVRTVVKHFGSWQKLRERLTQDKRRAFIHRCILQHKQNQHIYRVVCNPYSNHQDS